MDRRLVLVDLLVDLHFLLFVISAFSPSVLFQQLQEKFLLEGKVMCFFVRPERRTVRSGEFSGIFAGLSPFLLGLLNHVFLGRVVYRL